MGFRGFLDVFEHRSWYRPRSGGFLTASCTDELRVYSNPSFPDRRHRTKPGLLGLPGLQYSVPRDSKWGNKGLDERSSSKEVFSANFLSMVVIYGSVPLMATNEFGCQFLWKFLHRGTFDDVMFIFRRVFKHLVGLSVDQFGSYFVHKLLEFCSEEQKTHILILLISKPRRLTKISVNTSGKGVLQKLIESVKTKQHMIRLVQSPGFVSLLRDLNGHLVIHRLLRPLDDVINKLIFEETVRRLYTEILGMSR